MSAPITHLMRYSACRQWQRTHYLRQHEIPTEYAVSLPMPTLRWSTPAYISFASPVLRIPRQPADQDVPDRWWAMEALGGSLLIYTRTSVMPLTEGAAFVPVQLPVPSGTVEDLRNAVAEIERQMDVLVPAFFAGEPGDAEARYGLYTALEAYLPAPLMPQYRAAAPDFFAWLAA